MVMLCAVILWVVAFENGRVLLKEIDGVLRVHNIGANAEIVI